MIDDYFSLRQSVIKGGTLSDLLKEAQSGSKASADSQQLAADTAEQENTGAPVSEEEKEPEAVVKNSYIGSENDEDIMSFSQNIGKAVIPGAIIVPPDDEPEPEQIKEDDTISAVPDEDKPDDSKPVVRQPKPYVPPKSDAKVKIDYNKEESNGIRFSNLKKVPVDLVALAERYFPNAANKQDAIAAYIYVKEGKPQGVNIPDGVREIAEGYTGEVVSPADVEQSVKHSVSEFRTYVQKQLRSMAEMLYTVEMLVGYSVFDQLEFRQKDVPTPSDIDFHESGLSDLLKHAVKQANNLRKKEEYEKNRPY